MPSAFTYLLDTEGWQSKWRYGGREGGRKSNQRIQPAYKREVNLARVQNSYPQGVERGELNIKLGF